MTQCKVSPHVSASHKGAWICGNTETFHKSHVAPKRVNQAKKVKWSHVSIVLCLCTCTFLYCGLQILLPPPVGINTAWSGGPECQGDDFCSIGFCICPYETVCVKDVQSLILFALARCSAYFDYPQYVLLFVSKAHNLRRVLHRTYLSEFLPLDDWHHLHVFCGKFVCLEVTWHSFLHILRWYLAGDVRLLLDHTTGISGLVALLVTPLIVVPMLLQRRIRFEVRKALHYLALVWGLAICLHAPRRHIGMIMGSTVAVYTVDWLYGLFFHTYHMRTLQFTRLGSAVEVVWKHPEGFKSDGSGYVYMNLPWLSKTEWHPFSLLKHPTLDNHSCVCMAVEGDWTKAVHGALSKPSCRPGWVYGPFPSPFSTAVNYDNLITVASGIGITPSLATMSTWRETRNVHLIWMCRDPDLVEFYADKGFLEGNSWSFIFYTGTRKLVLGARPTNPKVMIMFGRPDLQQLIPDIVDNVSNGVPLPQELMDRARDCANQLFDKLPLEHFCDALEHAVRTYSIRELFEMALDQSDIEDGQTPSQISIRGFISKVRALCPVKVRLTDQELTDYFHAVDTDGSCSIDLDEFGSILQSLRTNADDDASTGSPRDSGVVSRILSNASREEIFEMVDGWQLMYCGGARQVISAVQEVARKYSISLKIESFAW